MTASATDRRPSRHWVWWLLLLGLLLAVASIVHISSGIVRASRNHDLDPAGAIVVFGAAQYDGRPSPVFRARLDHAFDLFERGLAPVVIITGGFASDPRFSEGGVGHDYLMHRGVSEAHLIAETTGSDTALSAQRVAVIMRANHLHTCVAVSDAYHVFRIRKLLEHEGMQVQTAPRPDSIPHSVWQRGVALLRESLSYLLWRLHLTV
jgi:uncharacterized SAM-binding protein YcdF (DUF218 family)